MLVVVITVVVIMLPRHTILNVLLTLPQAQIK